MEPNEKKAIRRIAIDLLDNEDGITESKFKDIELLLKISNSEDILQLVVHAVNTYFLNEDDAETLRVEAWKE